MKDILKYIDLYKINKTEEISTTKGSFLKIVTRKYHLNNNETIIRDTLERPCNKAAMIIPKTINNKYLMVIQPRVCTKRGVTVEFPAGLIDNDEDVIAGIKRELIEETGYDCDNIQILREYYQDPGASDMMLSLTLANNCQKVTEQKLDDDEWISFIELTFDEILELVNNNYIVDGNTLFCIEILTCLEKK